MPTYEYRCDACDHAFDEIHSFSDKPLKKCPKCKKPKLRRLFGTGAGIIFKGSGFYQTDYRSDSYKQSSKADETAASAKSDSASSDTSKGTESKTPAKAETKSPKSET